MIETSQINVFYNILGVNMLETHLITVAKRFFFSCRKTERVLSK